MRRPANGSSSRNPHATHPRASGGPCLTLPAKRVDARPEPALRRHAPLRSLLGGFNALNTALCAEISGRGQMAAHGRPPTRALVSLCVPGLAREHAEIDADLLQRFFVFAAGVLTENQLGIGRAMQPAVMLDLVLELAWRPPGIAERQDRAARSVPARDRLEDIERRGQANAFADRQRRVLDEEVARMQHEPALGIDRSALEHLDAART